MMMLLMSLVPSRSMFSALMTVHVKVCHTQFRRVSLEKKTRNTLSRQEVRRTLYSMQYEASSPIMRESNSVGAVHVRVGRQFTPICLQWTD